MDTKEILLTTTLVHEFLRCQTARKNFDLYMNKSHSSDKKLYRIMCHDSYSDFLAHLYEFYIGCIKKNTKYKDIQKASEIDAVFNIEAEKLLNMKRERIEKSNSRSKEEEIMPYKIPVPKLFGAHFRFIRNRRNHADFKRASPEHEITLAEFYFKYHFFIEEMYKYPQWLWNIEDIETHDWKEIENFSIEINKLRTRNGIRDILKNYINRN